MHQQLSTGKHARNTKNSSPLGELFDHACDNLTTAMATVAMFWLLGVEDERLLWTITQATSLSFCHEHMLAYAAPDKTIRFGFLNGPGEIISYGLAVVNLHYQGMMVDVWAAFVGLVAGMNLKLPWPTGALVDYGLFVCVLLLHFCFH
jgi:phosphatidylglycerophosphate synthase